MIPNISSDAATAGLPIDPTTLSNGPQTRRNVESNTSISVLEAANAAIPEYLPSRNGVADTDVSLVDPSLDIPDATAADAIIASLRAGILAQPGTAMQAQGGLSPRSVYDLLQ